jgi:hypothetical protein
MAAIGAIARVLLGSCESEEGTAVRVAAQGWVRRSQAE